MVISGLCWVAVLHVVDSGNIGVIFVLQFQLHNLNWCLCSCISRFTIELAWYLLSSSVAFKHPYLNGDGNNMLLVCTCMHLFPFLSYFIQIFVVAVKPEHFRGE